MKRTLFLLAPLAVLVGCAHVADSTRSEQDDQPATMMVTGSHIPQRVDPATGLPMTAWPVRVYTRQDLGATGTSGLAEGLQFLDPSLTTR
jgi:hypothetical protein